MRDRSYWKRHYVIETNAEEIERSMRCTQFNSGDRILEMICFEKGKDAPNIMISQGSGGARIHLCRTCISDALTRI